MCISSKPKPFSDSEGTKNGLAQNGGLHEDAKQVNRHAQRFDADANFEANRILHLTLCSTVSMVRA